MVSKLRVVIRTKRVKRIWVTTLMLKNLPTNVSQNEVLKFLCQHGFEDSIVLLYVPSALTGDKNSSKLGYGFVHLDTKQAAQALIRDWNGKFPFKRPSNGKPLIICDALVQGARENVAKWSG